MPRTRLAAENPLEDPTAYRRARNRNLQEEALRRRDNGEPVREIARSFNVHHATISRLTG
ncbi:MAG TPA: helix-turn-helix domain-containing protein [Pseudolabrys sp.]|jgi:DNA invertase Pin-like site-specific DNA recombinase|nr:helix-turn-helix domain-containing protein [Pseudolabrys sp.]